MSLHCIKEVCCSGICSRLFGFSFSNAALSGDPRSQNTDTSPQKEVTISAPSGSFDGKWKTEGYMECDYPFPSGDLNSDRSSLGYMLIEDGKFSLDIPRYSADGGPQGLSSLTISGSIDGHGIIKKMFLVFAKKASMRAQYRGSISTLGSTILFTATWAASPSRCTGKLSLFPIFDDVLAGDSDDEASILADLQQSSSKTNEAEAERIRKGGEARQQAEADRLEKERLAAELAASKRQEVAGKLILEIEAFAKTSPRQIDFLLLLELFHKAKPVTEGEWSEDLRDDYLALRKLVINDPKFIVFQAAAKALQAKEIRIRTEALQTEVIRAAAFLEHFVVENFSSPSAPLAVSVIGSLKEVLSSEDPETLQAAAANFSSFIDRESLQVQLSHWESEFGDSIVAEAETVAPLALADVAQIVASAEESQSATLSQQNADKEAPRIQLPSKLVTESPEIDIAGSVTDDSAIADVLVNERPVVLRADGSFRVRERLKIGVNKFAFVAIDEWGNRATKHIDVQRKRLDLELGDYHALVIGNNDYDDLPKLKTAVADAEAISAVLEDRYGFSVTKLINATRYDLIGALSELRATLSYDTNLLIYYAGHGIVDPVTERGYWLPVDADQSNSANWVSNDDITDMLKAIPARHILVVADSCYSGTLVRAAPIDLETWEDRRSWL
ncbi:caspase family protein, partial [Flavobacteriaceae bacterium]|nr:caspase family protein [Flavobacteriaceae bacterium]